MIAFLSLVVHVLVSPFKTRAQLEAEIVVLRHQLNVLRRRVPSKPKLTAADRLLFVWLYRLFPTVLNATRIIQPETVIRWHRMGFRLYCRWKSPCRGGRPKIRGGDPPPDPGDELGQPPMGSTAHSWRTAEAWD